MAGMKTNRSSNLLLLPSLPRRRRFGTRHGVAVLKAWRLALTKPAPVLVTQIEFSFARAGSS
jgi:hypothetical protein